MKAPTTARKLFLSYASADAEQVDRLANDLRAEGVAVWLDKQEMFVGDSVTKKIESGLKDSRFLGIWLTRKSLASPWVQEEWRAKLHEQITTGNVTVLPLLGEECEIPPLLRDKKIADFSKDYSRGLADLLTALRMHSEVPVAGKVAASHLSLEYFDIDSDGAGFLRREVSNEWYQAAKQRAADSAERLALAERIYQPGTPQFKNAWFWRKTRQPVRPPADLSPLFLLTLHNGHNRKIVLHTIELEVIHIEPYAGIADTGLLPPLFTYEVSVPNTPGTTRTKLQPQIGIAPGDIASFNVRLMPERGGKPRKSFKEFALEFLVSGSAGAEVRTPVFHVDLLT